MVAYSFRPRFIAPIRSGEKRQTIRKVGLKRHALPGEKLQLYAGMRTKHCEKIAEAVCMELQQIEISPAAHGTIMIKLDKAPWLYPDELEAFARADGFASPTDMRNFWLQNHGADHFYGVVIMWGDIALP